MPDKNGMSCRSSTLSLTRDALTDVPRPADLQILCLALSEWTQFEEGDDHGIRDLVFEKGLELSRSPVSQHRVDIILGLDRLEKFLRFKRA